MKKEYYLYLLLSSTMLEVPAVYAACVPTPDCEELGYTETECPEGGVKCPWDTTKLFCGPSCNLTTTKADCDANCLNVGTQSCSKNGVTYYSGCGVSKCTSGQSCVNGTCTCDSVYKYTCSGTGYAGGVGTTCGGKYTACTCAQDYAWSGSACVLSCDSSYQYTCSGANITGGSGTACGGKYTACTCNSPYTWSNGACSCPTTYKYTCSGTGYSGGSGTACGGKYTACTCISPYTWSSGACSCPTTYKYTCSGTGYSGGSGTACGGKYQSCTCSSGYEWKNGVCEQAVVCEVGNILNSDMTCSASKVSGKTPIGVVSYISGSTRLAINLVNTSLNWSSSSYTDISGITNCSSSSTAKNDFSGKSNTAAWVSYYGSSTSSYAPGYCYNFTTTGTSKGQWYLPAAGELYASIVTNYSAVNSGLSAAGGTTIQSGWYWSSSEIDYDKAWILYSNDGHMSDFSKSGGFNFYVRCVLAF